MHITDEYIERFCISLGDPNDNSKVWLELKDIKIDFNDRKYKKCEVDFIESAVYKIMKDSQLLDCTSTTGAAYIPPIMKELKLVKVFTPNN
jgi:hypothetical protein